MCGPSEAQVSEQRDLDSLSNILRNNYQVLFGNQLKVLQGLNNSMSPIVAAGPSQRGFSGAETSALQTQAINTSGAAARAAEQAARTYGAGQGGGGSSGLTSGITKQIESSIASQETGNEAARLGQIESADWATGRQNYWNAVGGENAVASGFNPNAAASGAIGANQGAFGEATQINQENNAMAQDIAGFATAAVGSASDIVKGFKGGH